MKYSEMVLWLPCLLTLSGCLTQAEKVKREQEWLNGGAAQNSVQTVTNDQLSAKDSSADRLKKSLDELGRMTVFAGTAVPNEIFKVKLGEPVVDFYRRVFPLAESGIEQIDMSRWLYETINGHYPGYVTKYNEVRSEGRLIPVQSFILKQDRINNLLIDAVIVSAVYGRVCALTYTTSPRKGKTAWQHGGHNDEAYKNEELAIVKAVLKKLTGSDQLSEDEDGKVLSLRSCGVFNIGGMRIALIPCQSGAGYSLDNTLIDLTYLETVFATLAGSKAQKEKQDDERRKKALDAL